METGEYQFLGALKRLGGDEELFGELAAYFIDDAPELVRAIHAGLAAGSGQDIRRTAHSLRGLFANFDAEQGMAFAESIEHLCAKGELQLVPTALAHLEIEVHSLRDALQEFAMHASPETSHKQIGQMSN